MNPPRTPEEIRSLWVRAREAGEQLAEASAQLNDALHRVELRFVEHLGPGARGRTSLCKNKDGWIEHLVFRHGRIYYENGWPGEPLVMVPLLSAAREVRILAAHRMEDLFRACGGVFAKPPV